MGASCSSNSTSEGQKEKGAKTTSQGGAAPCSCIDGRETRACFGSPGGDAGILLRVAYAYYLAAGKELGEEELGKLVQGAVKALGHPVYFHSDDHAGHHIDISKQVDDTEELFKPEHIGCGYFKLAITSPDKLNEEEGNNLSAVAKAVYKAVVSAMWADKSAINFVILEGDHKEDAVQVSNSTTNVLEPAGHIFVYHPKKEAEDSLKVVAALGQIVDLGECEDALKEKLAAVNERHWKGAIAVLAPGVEHTQVE